MIPRKNPVVVVTGASAGVGRAVVRKFSRDHKARIGLIARGMDGLEAAAREVRDAGGEALVIPADVANADAVGAAAAAVEDQLGPIDVWVNNAMVSMMSNFIDMTLEEFHRITNVTYLGYVHGTHFALKRMLPRDHGIIVQVGSALAYRSIPLQSGYCGAKHAILGFTESVRTELLHAGSNVKIRMVQLPGVNTPQFEWIRNNMKYTSKPVGRIYQPEVAADAIVWAAYHERPEMQVGYPTVEAILGEKIAPRMLDHYIAATVPDGHHTDIPEDPNKLDNLFEPVPGDHGARGPYSDRAWNHSPQLWLNKHRGVLALAGAGLAAAVGAAAIVGRADQAKEQA